MAQPELKVPPGDPIGKAIAAAAGVPASQMAMVKFNLPGGREAVLQFPIPLTPDDVVRIIGAFSEFFTKTFDSEHGPQRRSGLVIPQ